MVKPDKIKAETETVVKDRGDAATRVSKMKVSWWKPCPKRLLLIRPKVPGDAYTEIGSHGWAEDVKTKAIAEGWSVTDLSANDATRAKIEDAINDVRPHLIIHYDHGSSLTLWGQKSNALEPGLDDGNIALASERMVSTVSCQSANGLGPFAITQGVISYLGYTENHSFWTHRTAEFGTAANAANFVLLEGGTAQEAFDAGWNAYDVLYTNLLTAGDLVTAATALHDRDCLALLGSSTSTAPPPCICSFAQPLHCRRGLPDYSCKGLPLVQCIISLPDAHHCKYGNPWVACKAHPIHELCGLGLPNTPPVCGKGPDGCHAGPPLIMRDIYKDYPEDVVLVDRAKLPRSMRKAFNQMLNRMAREIER
jgi:hypothetical protein